MEIKLNIFTLYIMNKKYIKIFSLVGCPYSINSERIAKEHNINCEIKHVEQQDKNMVKKENNMNTFPQIFYIDKEEDVKFTIGGNDSFESLVNLYNDCMETKNSTDVLFLLLAKLRS